MAESWPKRQVMVEDRTGPDPVNQETALALYRDMVLLRTFDERALNLQRQGRIGTFPPSLGQEAAEIGSAHAIRRTDWLVPSYRDHGALYVHGVPLKNVLLFAMGRTASLSAAVRALPTSIPIATHLPHAVGLALAAKQQGRDDVAITYFGDGATSEGDFHEALNFAGVLRAPVIFFCQNNGWAISMPRALQTASATLAQKAVAYGIEGVRVDGNDVLAVHQVVSEAVERARRGEGPTLIEAETYRMGPHTTADDPTRYRPVEEYERWKTERDPLDRMARWLRARNWMTEAEQGGVKAAADAMVQDIVREAEAVPVPRAREMFRYVYSELPARLLEELAEIEEVEGPDA